MKLHAISFVLLLGLFCSCGSSEKKQSKDSQTSSTNSMSEGFWQLESLHGQKISNHENEERQIGFSFNEEENRINGFTGCNNFFGNYSLEDGKRIQFSKLGATKMACPDLKLNESDFLKIFDLAVTYNLEENKLRINNADQTTLAVFKRVDVSSEPITEKYWKLKTLEGQEVKMSENQEREIYFMLKTDENRVVGFAGCNRLSGNYSLEKGNRIHFSNMATTLMACPDLKVNEAEFLKVFELADNYTIDGDTLSLNVGKRAPLAVFEAVYFN